MPRRLTPAAGPSRPGEAGLKWYFATNEKRLDSADGLNMRLAVLTARRHTRLRPHLITTGFRNDLTEWMEAHGVPVIPGRQPMAETIRAGHAAGRYHTRYLGHWLRCEIPLIEDSDPYVLYTDTDVVFLSEIALPRRLPRFLACAPEFRISGANYFNSGVMVMNVANLRRTFPEFLRTARHQIDTLDGKILNDQFAYNNFYVGRWTPIDPRYNWKPYWGDPAGARILHFHGAKISSVRMLYERDLPWDDAFWRTVGSLVARFTEGYRAAFAATLAAVEGADLPERPWIEETLGRLAAGPPPIPPGTIDLGFMDHRYADLGTDAVWPLGDRLHAALAALTGRRPGGGA